MRQRRRFSREFKLRVMEEIAAGKSVAEAASEYQLHPVLIRNWQREHRQYADRAFTAGELEYDEDGEPIIRIHRQAPRPPLTTTAVADARATFVESLLDACRRRNLSRVEAQAHVEEVVGMLWDALAPVPARWEYRAERAAAVSAIG